MQIAFLVNEFPSISETFILNQISGLVEAGHQVDIYARNAQPTSKVHSLVKKHHLVQSTYYHPRLPKNYLIRYLKGLWLITVSIWAAPWILFRTLNFRKYGRHASSLRLLYRSIAFIRQGCPTYDVILCHFGPRGLIALDLKDIGALEGKVCVVFHGLDLRYLCPNNIPTLQGISKALNALIGKSLPREPLHADLLEVGKTVYTPLFEKADLLLPISGLLEKQLIELGCSPNKIQVHRMGIDVEQFKFKPKHFPEDGRIRLVSVARLVETKGIEYGIRALQAVIEHYSRVEYSVIGDGPLMPELSLLIQELELGKSVKLLGWRQQDEVINILENSHILIAPSVTSSNWDMEGIPVVLMEAMASGLPVISTWHSGIPELITSGQSGFLVPERNVSELAAQILKLIQQPETWSQLGQVARAKVIEDYETKKLNKNLINTLTNLTSQQGENLSS